MKKYLFILVVCELISLACVAANQTIKGHIVDESGQNVEFASIYVDSICLMSDKYGNFSLEIPDGMKKEMVISHVSYYTYRIPFVEYSNKKELNLTLKEKVSNLSDVTIVSEKKQKCIVGGGVRAPGDVAFHNIQNTQYETGPLFSVNKDWRVRNAILSVQKCTYAYCTIRLVIYEILGMQFVPLLHRPIYVQVLKNSDKKNYSVFIEEPLKLQPNHKYYLGVAVVASSGNGEIHFPAYFRKGCVRNLFKDRKKSFPVTLGISLYGIPLRCLSAK